MTQDRTYEFVQLDVFTQTPLMGNPLAIFTDACGLADEWDNIIPCDRNPPN